MSELIGQKGVFQFLNGMNEFSDMVSSAHLGKLIENTNISQEVFSALSNNGLFIESPEGFYISSYGKKVTLLLKNINGLLDDSELLTNLTHSNVNLRSYELITESITNYFIDSIEKYPNFIRLYICSPWIRLDDIHLQRFQGAVMKASRLYKNLEILIISKPKEGYNKWEESSETFRVLKMMKSDIFTNMKLHTKLYICEPGSLGGSHCAIIGSENLTGMKNIELAIKIENNNDILNKLQQYFFEISLKSKIFKEV